MVEYNFDAEMDLLAEKIPGFYEDAAARHIAIQYRIEWIGIKMHAIQKIFGTNEIPKIATEEHIQMVKEAMREEIAGYPNQNTIKE